MDKGFVIAIDGPVASGKGTIAPKLARRIGGVHIYTGGTYRSIALYCLRNDISIYDSEEISKILAQINIDLRENKVLLNGEDVTEAIKIPEVADASSEISVYRDVRESMVKVQQKIAERDVKDGKIIVAEGRDTATKVFPDAKVKIYLTADPKVRAERRMMQYQEKGLNLGFEKVLKETLERDERDTQREIDPLVADPEKFGYTIVNNSNQTEDQTIDIILEKIKSLGISI